MVGQSCLGTIPGQILLPEQLIFAGHTIFTGYAVFPGHTALPGQALLALVEQDFAPGTLLPRGFFVVVGGLFILALLIDHWAIRLRLPTALGVLLLGLSANVLHNGLHHISHGQVETLHVVSLALLLFYAGLRTDLRRIGGVLTLGLLLSSAGVLLTMLGLGLGIWWLASPGGGGLMPGLPQAIPLTAAMLAATCLTAIDGSATDGLLRTLRRSVPPSVGHLLELEADLTTAAAILCFGFVAGLGQADSHGVHDYLHASHFANLGSQFLALGQHLLAGILAGGGIGLGARLLMAPLLGIGEQLLILAISIAFMAYGLGNFLGGGGLVAVFTAGLVMASQSDGKKEPSHSSPQQHHSPQNHKSIQYHQSLQQVLLPFNTTAEFTILLLLGLLVYPPDLLAVLPLALVTSLLLLLVVRPATVGLLGWGSSLNRREQLLVACCGMRSAVPLALSITLLEEVPHLRGVPPQMAEALATNLSALVFAVVLINLLLQGLLVPRLLPRLTIPQLAALQPADRLRTAPPKSTPSIHSDDPTCNPD